MQPVVHYEVGEVEDVEFTNDAIIDEAVPGSVNEGGGGGSILSW